MSISLKKRIGTFVVSAAMLVSSATVVSSTAVMSTGMMLSVDAAGKEVAINKVLESTPDGGDGDKTNTYLCAASLDEYTPFSDTAPKGIADVFGTGITSLQFNFEAEQPVTNFSYYIGYSLSKAPWWADTGEAIECTPNKTEFSVVYKVSGGNMTNTGKFQIQNCYSGYKGEVIPVTLKSITVNGTTDTSNGAPLPDDPGSDDPYADRENPGVVNTGGLGYTSGNAKSGVTPNYTFKDNKDGTATITATHSKKIEDVGAKFAEDFPDANVSTIYLEPGEGHSEDDYLDEKGKARAEEIVRGNGDPLNSHKFRYSDFGLMRNSSETDEITIESLSVVLKTDGINMTRLMYGGGLNVAGKSPADTEFTKNSAGLKKDKDSAYWYNDMGKEAHIEALEGIEAYNAKEGTDIKFGVEVGTGCDLTDLEVGDYARVTWDVPKDVQPYVSTNAGDMISFQLWYGEIEGDKPYNPMEDVKVELASATLTYTESITFPYLGSKSKTYNAKIDKDGGEKFLYSDFDMMGTDDVTCDVYAVLFDVKTSAPVNDLVFGLGTNVIETCQNSTAPYWVQVDGVDHGNSVSLVSSDAASSTYTFMWIMPGAVAKGKMKDATTGAYGGYATNYVSTEQEGDNFQIAAYYAGNDGKEVSGVTVTKVTTYYTLNDKENAAKRNMFEDELYATPGVVALEIGESQTLRVPDIPNLKYESADDSIAVVAPSGTITAVAPGQTTIYVTSPQGQKVEVKVTVKGAVTTTTKATTTTTKPTTTTTTTVTTKATTTFDPKKNALYGDVNLDGKITLSDCVLLNKYVATNGGLPFNEQQKENAQCVYDGSVDYKDCKAILDFMVEKVRVLGPTAVWD